VWLCATHARLVDRDEVTYTIPMLEQWRAFTEHKASLRHTLGREIEFDLRSPIGVSLAEHSIEIKALSSENEEIGEAFLHCGVHQVWGDKLAKAVRDLSIEVARDAFQHGRASSFSMSIEPKRIVLKDDGQAFRYEDVLAQVRKSGGAAALQRIRDRYSDHLVLSPMHTGQGNELIIGLIHSIDDIPVVTNCFHTPTRQEIYNCGLSIPPLPQCDKNLFITPTTCLI